MKAVKVETDGSIKLPEEMLRLFPTSTELAVWTEGDTIVLKRLQPLRRNKKGSGIFFGWKKERGCLSGCCLEQ